MLVGLLVFAKWLASLPHTINVIGNGSLPEVGVPGALGVSLACAPAFPKVLVSTVTEFNRCVEGKERIGVALGDLTGSGLDVRRGGVMSLVRSIVVVAVV